MVVVPRALVAASMMFFVAPTLVRARVMFAPVSPSAEAMIAPCSRVDVDAERFEAFEMQSTARGPMHAAARLRHLRATEARDKRASDVERCVELAHERVRRGE